MKRFLSKVSHWFDAKKSVMRAITLSKATVYWCGPGWYGCPDDSEKHRFVYWYPVGMMGQDEHEKAAKQAKTKGYKTSVWADKASDLEGKE